MNKIKKVFIISFIFCSVLLAAYAEETLSWQDCIREAAKNNPDLISAVESVKQSEAGKKITASALYPQINSSVSASTARSDNGTSSSTADNYSYGLSGSQLIFDGFKTLNNVKAAGQNVTAAKENYRFVSTDVRLALRSAFVNLLRTEEFVRVAEDIIKIRRGNLELIALRYQSGFEHRGALLTAEANLAEANFELSQAQRGVVLAQRQLTKAMGRKEFVPMLAKGDFTVVDTAKVKPDYDALIKNNPSILQAAAKMNAAAFNIKSAYASFYPSLNGEAQANKSGQHWSPQNDQWNLGLNLSLPIFEGGLRLAQVSQAKAAYNQAVADERSIRDSAILSLEQTWVVLQDTLEQVDVQYKNLIATEERSKIAEAEYSTGFISYDNWTIIEDNLVSAKKSYLNAQAAALLAEANWIQAKGETLEYAKN